MNYKVIVDMSRILSRLKKLKDIKLGVFGNETIVIDVEANNPDDACYLVYKEFCDFILDQSTNTEIRNLLKELKNDFLVVQLIEE